MERREPYSGSVFSVTSVAGRCGSVLVFVIIILGLLAMLGTAFLVVVRQASRASSNALGTLQADLAAQAGLRHAVGALRQMVATYTIGCRDGVFYPNLNAGSTGTVVRPPFKYTRANYWEWENSNYTPATNGPPSQTSLPYWHFESADGRDPVLCATILAAADPRRQRFTIAPLEAGGTACVALDANSQPISGNISVEAARPLEIQGTTNDFYNVPQQQWLKQLPRVGSVRGEYCIWIKDMDASLYARPQFWGLDVTGVDALLAPAPPPPCTTWEETACFNILKYYCTLPAPDGSFLVSPNETDLPNDLLALPWNPPPATPPPDPRIPDFGSHQELATALQSLHPFVEYLNTRADLDYHFTVYRDHPDSTGANTPFSNVKDNPVAVNINTAPIEVIAALLSMIPAEEDGAALGLASDRTTTTPDRPWKIARRIVAKRPFLCRMDFEDFLAAHLRGASDGVTVNPNDPGSITIPVEADLSKPQTMISFVRMVYFAISRRWGPGYFNPADTRFQSLELTLAQYLEIPGVPNDALQFRMKPGATPFWPNQPYFQLKRFEFFFTDNVGDPLRTDALITPKEFNNIINSVTSIPANDDVQNPAALPGKLAGPGTVVVSAGPDGVLQTTPQGDDVLDKVNKCITAGPNGIAETWIGAYRPSYYTFSDDLEFVQDFWEKVNAAVAASSTPAACVTGIGVAPAKDLVLPTGETVEKAEGTAIRSMRLYYRLPLVSSGGSPPPPPMASDASMADLLSWRCLPEPYTAPVPSRRLAGFYQMAFDDWTNTPGPSIGPMQAAGDPFWPDDTQYATAKSTSGRNLIQPPVDFDEDMFPDGNGDVQWSPQIAFRSRFFGVYVMGRAVLRAWNQPEVNDPGLTGSGTPEQLALRGLKPDGTVDPGKLKVIGERRLEAVYDALRDQVIWQRAPVSDKRSLGGP